MKDMKDEDKEKEKDGEFGISNVKEALKKILPETVTAESDENKSDKEKDESSSE